MGPNHKSSLLIFIGVVFWMLAVLGGYYVYHKPFSAEQLLVWLQIGYQSAIGGLIVVCGGGIGYQILRKTSSYESSFTILSVGLGLGVLGTFYLVISWLVGIKWYWSFLLLAGIILGFRGSIIHWLHDLIPEIMHLFPQDRYSFVLMILIGFLLVASWLTALAPPIAFDALVYHLSLPVTYLFNGKFIYTPSNTFWGMPQLGEMLYLFAMSIGGLESGALIGWLFGILSLIGLCEIWKGFGSRDTAEMWVSYSALLCGLTFSDSLWWGYVDWIAFFWGVCAIRTLIISLSQSVNRNFLLVGFFCGFALATKYTAGVILIAVVVSVLIFYSTKNYLFETQRIGKTPQSMPSKVLALVFLFVGCLIAFSPWLIKNLIAVNQPFYPLILPSGEMTADRIRFYSGLEPWGNWGTVLLLPLTSTMLGVEGKEGFNASIGPLFLILAPMSILSLRKKENSEKGLLLLAYVFVLTAWIVWGLGSRSSGYLIQTRLYWGIFPAAVILSAIGYRNISTLKFGPIRIGILIRSMVLFVLVLTVIEYFSLFIQRRVLDFVSGQIDRQSYLKHNLGWHYLAMHDIRELDKQKSTILLFEPRSLYCVPNCDGDEILDEWYTLSLNASSTIEDILMYWKRKGYQSILIYHKGADFVRQNDHRYYNHQWKLFDELVSRLTVIKNYGEAYSLYELP